jgi:amino acid transporter
MILGMLAFTGFDAAATAAEEAQAPRSHVPRALIAGLAFVTLFWAANSWVLTLSTPTKAVVAYTAQGHTAITPVASAYWGWGQLIVIATAFTGLTAIYIGCVQAASRVVFALARHGLLPAPLAIVHGERRVPSGAVILVTAACAIFALISFAVLGDALDAFTWWSGALVFFAAIAFTGVNVANLLYFRRIARDRFHWLHNLVVPAVGIAANAYLIYAAFFVALWNAPFRTGRSIVLACLALLALQIAAVAFMRLRHSHRLRADAPIGVEG